MKLLLGFFLMALFGEGALAQGMELRPILREGYASFAETKTPVELAQQRAEQSAFKWCAEGLHIPSAYRVSEWSYKAKLDSALNEIGYIAEATFSCVKLEPKPPKPTPPASPERRSCKSRPYGPYCYWVEDRCECWY